MPPSAPADLDDFLDAVGRDLALETVGLGVVLAVAVGLAIGAVRVVWRRRRGA